MPFQIIAIFAVMLGLLTSCTGQTPSFPEPVRRAPVATPAPSGDCGRLCEWEFWDSTIHSSDPRYLVRAELENGADPRFRRGTVNPLAITIKRLFNPEIVRLLLEHGADPNAATHSLEPVYDLCNMLS